MASKPKTTEWRIIGVSGDTVDGREISAEELQQMAEQYDPEVYGARINLEHLSFIFPGIAGGYGDVVALKAEPWHKDKTKTALLAKLSVRPVLQNIWDSGEKIYTSMEIISNFAGTGKAYLAGLAITDTPASLGTTANFTAARSRAGETQFAIYRETSTQEADMSKDNQTTAAEQPLTKAEAEGIFSRLLAKFTKADEQPAAPAAPDAAPAAAPAAASAEEDAPVPAVEPKPADDGVRQELNAAAALMETLIESNQKQAQEFADLKKQFAALMQKLETEPAGGDRQPHAGDGGTVTGVNW